MQEQNSLPLFKREATEAAMPAAEAQAKGTCTVALFVSGIVPVKNVSAAAPMIIYSKLPVLRNRRFGPRPLFLIVLGAGQGRPRVTVS